MESVMIMMASQKAKSLEPNTPLNQLNAGGRSNGQTKKGPVQVNSR